jgi:hypothetical protein
MADRVPVKAIYSGSDVTSLGELASGDTIAASYINGLAGEVTGTGGATVVADNIVDEANLKISNSPTNGYVLTAQSGNTGGLTWAADSTTDSTKLPLAGGALTGALTTNSTIDGRDVAADGVLATAALPKSGGTMTGSVKGSTDTDASNTGSITLNFTTNQNFVLTLTGNVTLANPSTEAVGQSGFIAFIQDGTGSRTVSLGTDYETAAAAGITLTTTASATDLVPYLVVASNRILLGAPQLAFA